MSDGKTVLIVDDEPDAIEIVETMLSEIAGVAVISATDGDSGLAKVRESKPDLVILDVQMPGKSGFDVFTELRQDDATKDLPVIMLTGVAEKTGLRFSADDMAEFLGKEPEAYIEKPVDPATLQATVSRVLGL